MTNKYFMNNKYLEFLIFSNNRDKRDKHIEVKHDNRRD